jgi:hypothetical protein
LFAAIAAIAAIAAARTAAMILTPGFQDHDAVHTTPLRSKHNLRHRQDRHRVDGV